MGTSKADKAQSRERILAAAAQQIRSGGLDSIAIGDLMKTAGLTHGAFYAHFPSRAALIAAALDRALADGSRNAHKACGPVETRTLAQFVEAYLSPAHRDAPHKGCAVPALAAEAGRSDEETRAIMSRRMERYIDDLATTIGEGEAAREEAIATWSAMVGALMLSRLFAGEPLGDAVLDATRKAILGRVGKP
ncbi:regulatory protein, TetR [Novosphingobium nitrogenifigens DSM 19370]|uniref:Regulatory protein, TetR n=1 Tax=Novosphingobium nitrogenifigens DSM 19370 TaxID=983920 RepID=F1ZC67_9SPHN|nr:TetR/AcrR family transcriptional regulator [Novosphingobium nitrogenifigens]EGD57796.1 regulatory protein, TetR [Novosphingobium nitrogenifigens DSM 19370]